MTPVPRRLVPFILVAAAFLYACGPRPSAGETQVRKTPTGQRPLEATVDVSTRDGVSLAFHVANRGSRKVELDFPSGLTHDFEVQDTTGRTLWRWSEGRLFTQSMQNRVLDRDESVTWEADWSPTTPSGVYVAVVSLKSSSHPIEQRVRFSLP